jgi:Flp pilus assembly pilin Flp
MRKLLETLRKTARKGQTTTEYVIILGLVALGSIGVILLFGNQVRALFSSGTRKMAGKPSEVTTTYADQAEDAAHVHDMLEAFEK